MPRETTPPTVGARDYETHPAFGVIHASRGSWSGDGAVLFDSDVKHRHTVTLTIETAERKRDLHHDFIHTAGRTLVEVEMSEAQWASFVSSMNTSGVPCTIRRTESNGKVPGLPYDPRLAHSMDEVRGVADRLFTQAKEAMAAYDALDSKAPAKEKREALSRLRSAVNNAESNVAFAAQSLNKHAENVVQKARADIEAMVSHEATRLGLSAGETRLLELPV